MLTKDEIEAALTAGNFDIRVVPETDSTNARLLAAGDAGAPAYTVLAAERQTAGRGRRGRSFLSEKGGLYLSILLRLPLAPEDTPIVTAAAAVAARRAIKTVTGKDVSVKWVNDLFYNGKKVAGILAEGRISDGKTLFSVVGIGVNTANVDFPPELENIAGTLFTGEEISNARLAAAFLSEFYKILEALPDRAFLDEYRKSSCVLGKTVEVVSAAGSYFARAVAIDDEAALLVTKENGETVRLLSGEISVKL